MIAERGLLKVFMPLPFAQCQKRGPQASTAIYDYIQHQEARPERLL